MREKLPGIGSCDGAKEEITVCDNEVNQCKSVMVDNMVVILLFIFIYDV